MHGDGENVIASGTRKRKRRVKRGRRRRRRRRKKKKKRRKMAMRRRHPGWSRRVACCLHVVGTALQALYAAP